MAYLVQASALQLMQLFQQEWLIIDNTSANALAELQRDLQSTQFLGPLEDAEHFIKIWDKKSNPPSYTAGNISASNLSLLFARSPLQKEHELEEEFCLQYQHKEFAYINEQKQPCGLMIMTRQDEPTQWMIGLVTNTHLPPQKRTVTLLASFALNAFITEDATENHVTVIEDVADANNPLFQHINSPFIANFITAALTEKPGELSAHWLRINHLLRTVAFSYDEKDKVKVELSAEPVDLAACAPHALLADNLFLDMAQEFDLTLSTPILEALCNKESSLYQELSTLGFADNKVINTNLLVMVFHFYEQGLLPLAHDFLHAHVFSKVLAGSFWDETQIQLIPHLIHEGYSLELFQLILSQPAYYDSVLILTELGLDQSPQDKRSMLTNIPLLFNESDKLDELEFIYRLPNRHCRALCLIFWAKNESTEQCYQDIISATQQYPYLAETLCALSKAYIRIEDLHRKILTPQEHLRDSLKYHFAEQFERYNLDSSLVKVLSDSQLIKAHQAFEVLHHAQMTDIEKDAKLYQLVLEKSTNGRLWRLFLPDFAHVALEADRNILIHYLHVGVTKNIKSLDDIILDASLATQARELRERLICVNQLLSLSSSDFSFSDEVITFTASRDELKAQKFRQVIIKINKECNNLVERLSQSSDKYGDWETIEARYRMSLYQIAYDSLSKPGINYVARLEKAQQEVLELVDPATTLWWKRVLVAIANAVILLFSGSLANKIKEQQTGNYWFFNQTRPGELVRHLQKDIIDIIETPEQYPVV